MKQLVLTGIAQETSLSNPDDTFFMLVFNDGEVRVPTNELGVSAILESLGSDKEETPPPRTHPEGAEVFGGDQWQDDGVYDDDEDDDINDGVGSV